MSGSQPGTVADDLEALAKNLGLRNFHLVGIAGGGYIAIDFAVAYPDRVRTLVIAASSGGVEDPEMDQMRARLRYPGLNSTPSEFREVGVSYRAANPEGTRRWLEIEHRAQQPGALEQPLRSPQTRVKLGGVRAPTLILAGGADLLAPPAMMQLLVKYIPKSRFISVPDAGHAVAWEQPSSFNSAVLAFIDTYDSSVR